jgi:alkanesulfonate monooxygenase SsuD/methylene tetrahydromethanopterin reductase-like flavin-dependent oxidoreductase (luciferase family)
MTALAGEVSEGMITHPTNTPPRYIREVTLPRLQKGADRAARNLNEIKLILSAAVATGRDDKAVAAEKEKQRNLLGFLYSTPSYWPSLEMFGWQDRGERLLEMTREGNWEAMVNIIDDEMLETFVPCGTYTDIAEILIERFSDLSTMINFPLPDDPADDMAATKAIKRLQEA